MDRNVTRTHTSLALVLALLDQLRTKGMLTDQDLGDILAAWVNEAREVPKAIIDACTMRVGRFPSMRDGGPSWSA